MSDLPAIPTLRDLVRTEPPEVIANTREDLVGYAEAARLRRDTIALREGLRAARVLEWEMAQRWPVNKQGLHRLDDRPSLSPAGDTDAKAWSRVYAVGRADIDDILQRELIEDLVQRAFRPTSTAIHVGQNTGVPEWYTPAEIIASARRVLGGIDLDPASSDIANQTVAADRYYTVDDDGLDLPWEGRVWLNPPYSASLVGRFIDRLLSFFDGGDVKSACVLTNNSTDTRWWQALAHTATAVCFPARRVRFLDPDGRPGAPLQGQSIAYLGEDVMGFDEEFGKFGEVL